MADDAKKFAVKEKFKARPGIGRIMPEKGGELVPVAQQTQTRIEELPKAKTKKTERKTEAKTEQKTVVAPTISPSKENTQITQFGTFAQDKTSSDRPIKKKAPKRVDRTPWLFLVPAMALIAFLWFDESGNHATSSLTQSGRMDDRQLEDRATMHRQMTGWKMNRERADVQIQNHFTAPALPFDATKQKAPDIMAGVPLVGEEHPNSEREKNKGISADHPDTHIMYGLQEEQDRQIFDQMAEQRFVKDFIENARKEGYVLEVLDDGTVKILKSPDQAGRRPAESY